MADEVRLDVGAAGSRGCSERRPGRRGGRCRRSRCVSVKLVQRFGIGEVDAFEAEPVAELLLQLVEPRLLQRRIVIIVEIVDADDLVAALQQRARRRRADEPRSPRDQNSHGRSIGGAVRSAKALEAEFVKPILDLRHRPRRDVHRRRRALVRRPAAGREAAVGKSRPV